MFTGDVVFREQSAHKEAVWSIAVRPDGKGFMTGSADKLVKFWDFTLVGRSITY